MNFSLADAYMYLLKVSMIMPKGFSAEFFCMVKNMLQYLNIVIG